MIKVSVHGVVADRATVTEGQPPVLWLNVKTRPGRTMRRDEEPALVECRWPRKDAAAKAKAYPPGSSVVVDGQLEMVPDGEIEEGDRRLRVHVSTLVPSAAEGRAQHFTGTVAGKLRDDPSYEIARGGGRKGQPVSNFSVMAFDPRNPRVPTVVFCQLWGDTAKQFSEGHISGQRVNLTGDLRPQVYRGEGGSKTAIALHVGEWYFAEDQAVVRKARAERGPEVIVRKSPARS